MVMASNGVPLADLSSADLIRAYFAATSQEAVDAAEVALRARSSGPIQTYFAVTTARRASVAWLGRLRAVPGGLRSYMLFGESDDDHGTRIAHVELALPLTHP